MDERRAHLVAAAEAVRTWVHAQRAARSGEPVPAFTALHGQAFASSTETVAGILADPVGPLETFSVEDTDTLGPARASIDFSALAGGLVRSVRALSSLGLPPLRRFWRLGLAAAVVLACTGTARVYWPVWSKVLKAQLAAAGAHAAVFQRLKAADAVAPAAPAAPRVARPAPPPRRTGSLQVDSTPPGVHVIVDGQDRGITPLTVNNLSVGGHVVVLRGEAGQVRRTTSIKADQTTQMIEGIYSGWLHVSSPIELQISEAGSGIRLDDRNHALLPPGPHEIRFENRLFGFVEVRKFDVSPGETTSISIVPPASRLSVVASTPAEILLNGALIGGTPLTDFVLPLGTHHLIVRNAAGAERRTTLTVTVEPVRLDIDFSKP